MGKAVVTIGLIAAALWLLGSFAGGLHPAGDSLAVVREPVAAIALALAALRYRLWLSWGIGAAALGVLALGVIARVPATEVTADVVLYQKNLLYRAADRLDFVEDVRVSGADFVTLQEVSRANRPVLQLLRGDFPHQQVCDAQSVGGVAILSRRPFVEAGCLREGGMAWAEVTQDDAPLIVVSLHIPWPWPRNQSRVIDLAEAQLGQVARATAIIGGDFNMVPWGHSIRRIEALTGTQRVGHVERTFAVFGYPIAIDHVLVTGGVGTAEVRPLLGSDHYGVLGRVDLP